MKPEGATKQNKHGVWHEGGIPSWLVLIIAVVSAAVITFIN